MGLLQKIFGKKADEDARRVPQTGYETLGEYNPFTWIPYDGKMYQQEIVRSAIERFSTSCAKLEPEITGNANRSVAKIIKSQPNPYMTWPQFLSTVATRYDADATTIVVPSYKGDGVTVDAFWSIRFDYAEVLVYRDEPWIKFHFPTGKESVCRLEEVAIISKYQYTSDFFGEDNCLDQTLKLIDAQNKAQVSAIKNGANIRFIGAMNGIMHPDDIEKKREDFVKTNLGLENESGILLYDQTFQNVTQVEPQQYTMDSDTVNNIEESVYNYFGINKSILQNDYTEEKWDAWYEGRIEPFATKLGEAMTKMVFTPTQQMHGNRIMFSSNRLEYASNASKRNMVRDMIDRAVITINEGREILQLPPVPGGDTFVIRGEYINASAASNTVNIGGGGNMPKNEGETDFDLGGDDQIYKDSDAHDADDFTSTV